MSRRHVIRWTIRCAIVIAAALLLHACAAMQVRAPDVSIELENQARTLGFDPASLSQGREIFITRCARCHATPEVHGYSTEQWQRILPRMSQRARLDAAQESAVRAYVLAARQSNAPDPPLP